MTADDMRDLRKRLGMTQVQLADALGLAVGSISNYEGGRRDGYTPRKAPRQSYPIPRVVALACMELLTCLGMRTPTDRKTPVDKLLKVPENTGLD